MMRLVTLLVAVLAMGVTAGRAGAQGRERPAISVAAGGSEYDLAGVGRAVVAAGRVEIPVANVVILEPGITWMRYDREANERVAHLLPELSIQLQSPAGAVRPYLGGGAGWGMVVAGGTGSTFTLHAVGGVRVRVAPAWFFRGELRVRAVDPFHGTTADYTAGLGWRL